MRNLNEMNPLFQLETFTEGKTTDRNEDCMGYSDTAVVLSDGATDKTGIRYGEDEGGANFKTGGEIASRICVDTVLRSTRIGSELIGEITNVIQDFYKVHNPGALTDSALRFDATIVAARVVGDELVVTQVGDTSFRINGKDVYADTKAVDAELASIRSAYIEETGDVEGARAVIMPRLIVQHKLHNNEHEQLGYGAIDGSPVPEKFIHIHRFLLDSVQTLEIVSDGYFGAFPDAPTLAGYEQLHRHIEQTDPYKYKTYPSTKVSDDRSVMIVSFA